jgi:hypothetical protein
MERNHGKASSQLRLKEYRYTSETRNQNGINQPIYNAGLFHNAPRQPNDHKLSHAGREPGNSTQPKEQNGKS